MLVTNYLAAEPECSTPLIKQLGFGHNAWAISIHLHFSHPISLTFITFSEYLFSKQVSHQNFVDISYLHYPNWIFVPSNPMLRGGAGKSLARPGRKQATATKLGIYSTYSPRSSVHFFARCSNFCKPLKKKIRSWSVQPGHRGGNDLRVGRKLATFQLFFQSQEQVIVRRGQIQRIGWVIKILEA